MAGVKDSAVLKVAAEISEPQKAIAEINALVKKMADNVNTSSAIGVKAFRSEAAAAEEMLKKLGASDKQLGDLTKTTQKVEQAASAHLSRIGGAARTMASGFEAMARTGNVAGEATKQIIAQGSELAFTFGAAGPIVGAIGITGLAIFSMYERWRTESEETKKKALTDILAIASSMDLVKSAQGLQKLTSGDIDARLLAANGRVNVNDLSAEQLGIEGLRLRIAQRKASIPDKFVATGTGPGGVTQDPNKDIRDAIAADEKALAELVKKRTDAEVLYTAALSRTNDMAKVGAEIAKSTADQKTRQKEAEERIQNLIRGAKLAERDDKAMRATFAAQDDFLSSKTLGLPSALSGSFGGLERPTFTRVTKDTVAGGMSLTDPTAWDRIAQAIDRASGSVEGFGDSLSNVTGGAVTGFSQASASALSLWVSGSKGAGAAFKQYIGQAIASVAGKEAAMSFAQGIKDIASGLRASADPITAPLAGFYFSAAAKDFAAGAAFAAIGGGAMAMSGGGAGGGGGTRGASFNSGLGSTMADMGKPDADIRIYGGVLSTDDTRQMDALADAIRALSGRNVNIIPA